MNISEKIVALRYLMTKHNIQAYIIPSNDPHQSEYVAQHWKYRQWISDFTGSAGTVVVTNNFAGLWTDSRYFLQAECELAQTEIELMKLKVPHTPAHLDWLTENLTQNSNVGVDANILTINMFETIKRKFAAKNINLITKFDFIAEIWTDRPQLPTNKIQLYPSSFAGESRQQKLGRLRAEMKNQNADYHLITTLDDIAWLYNIRGNDVDCNPIVIAYALVSKQEAHLYILEEKIEAQQKIELLQDGITIKPYHSIKETLTSLPAQTKILIDKSKINVLLFESIAKHSIIFYGTHITTLMKACKNDTEIEQIKLTMLKDGVSLVKFFMWLEKHLIAGDRVITETSVDSKLQECRQLHPDYMGPSFETIAAYASNGAIVHYTAQQGEDAQLKPDNIFLLDSGGQYQSGTTDITRTITLGNPTEQQKRDFTLVLKGHIQLATARFPNGTKGYQLDILARKALWDNGLDYGHGTGHGVGHFLNVHEGPQNIGTAPINVPIQKGMILSNEPGLYRQNEYGIRIESILLTIDDCETNFAKFLKFETLSLCPIDTLLIEKSLLTTNEIEWLNTYHQQVYETLAPYLNHKEKTWLQEHTLPI